MPWQDFPGDFEELANALYSLEETTRTADSLRLIAGYIGASWRTQGIAKSGPSGIDIPLPRKKALHPRLCNVQRATMHFEFELGGEFDEFRIPKRADFQICVDGFLEVKNSIVELQDHWRVDSHTFVNPEDAKEPHPYFHFQRGGHAQEAFANHESFVPGTSLPDNLQASWRGLMQSPGPRIPMIPHCPILAIDFAIGQHDGGVWHRLRNIQLYREIIKRAQERLWSPFFQALSQPKLRDRYFGPVFIR